MIPIYDLEVGTEFKEAVVQELLGKSFKLSDLDYVIVDVIDIRGDKMVYAEARQPARGAKRAAFHLNDLHRLADFPEDLRSA